VNATIPNVGPELVSLALSGNTEAQKHLVQRIQPRCYTIARSILGNRLDAEDTTSLIVIELLKSIGTYRGGSFLAWADRIAVRTAMQQARLRRIRATRYESHDDLDELARPHEAERDGESLSHCLPKQVMEYLALLPETQRVAVVLRHVMDYSVDEIAALTEVSPNTVKDRLLRGREQLRRTIRRDLTLGPSVGRNS
jgi:RNA polymerase sigma-70 factor (ECF subfamily)